MDRCVLLAVGFAFVVFACSEPSHHPPAADRPEADASLDTGQTNPPPDASGPGDAALDNSSADAAPSFDLNPSPSLPARAAAIKLVAADPAGALVGRHGEVDFTLEVIADPPGRRASFAAPDGTELIMTTDDRTDAWTIQAGRVRWQSGETLDAAAKTELETFARTASGHALVEVAAHLYFRFSYPEFKPHRVLAIQLYAEIAPYYLAKDKLLDQPAGSTTPGCTLDGACQLRSGDAVFGCNDGTLVFDTLILMDRLPEACRLVDEDRARSHAAQECYGGCGESCRFCQAVTYACNDNSVVTWEATPPVDGTAGTSTPVSCFSEITNDQLLPADRFINRPALCSSSRSFPAGMAIICSAKPACYTHDECTRHDTKVADLYTCHTKGKAACGAVACAWGKPPPPFTYKWFNALGEPFSLAGNGRPNSGVCHWTMGCSGGSCAPLPGYWEPQASAIPHDPGEHADCLVHGCKHQGSEDVCRCSTDAECASHISLVIPKEDTCQNGICRACERAQCAGCGQQSDGCGGTMDCPCPTGQTCKNGACCTLATCPTDGRCGRFPDGCGGFLDCGCPTSQRCATWQPVPMCQRCPTVDDVCERVDCGANPDQNLCDCGITEFSDGCPPVDCGGCLDPNFYCSSRSCHACAPPDCAWRECGTFSNQCYTWTCGPSAGGCGHRGPGSVCDPSGSCS